MRLIDADSLLANMDKGMQGTAREYLKFYQMAVRDEPTVYDVDEVLEQLEDAHINCFTTGDYKYNNAIDKSIEIVKAGIQEKTQNHLGSCGRTRPLK